MRETLEIIAKYPSVGNAAQEMRALARDALRRADYVPVANRDDPVGPLVDLCCRVRDWIQRRSSSSDAAQ